MAGAGGGGYKALAPSKIKMDTSKAMAILGFSSSQVFEHTEIEEIQSSFLRKVQMFEMQCHLEKNPRNKLSKREDLRKVNEAFQFLVRKKRRLTGRSMTENWNVMGGKSSTAMNIISSLKVQNPEVKQKKRDELDSKKQAEVESQRANSLADELLLEAGHQKRDKTTFNSSHCSTNASNPYSSRIRQNSKVELKSQLLAEERNRRPSAFSSSSYPGTLGHTRYSVASSCNSLPIMLASSAELPSCSSEKKGTGSSYAQSEGARTIPSATSAPKRSSYSSIRPPRSGRGRGGSSGGNSSSSGSGGSSVRTRIPRESSSRKKKSLSPFQGEFLSDSLEVNSTTMHTSSASDLLAASRASTYQYEKDYLEAKAHEEEGIMLVRKALSSLNLCHSPSTTTC